MVTNFWWGGGVKSLGFPCGSVVKNLSASAEDARDKGLIPGSGRSPGRGNCNLLQYSCLENSTDRGAWWGTVHAVIKSQTWLSYWAHMHEVFRNLIKTVNSFPRGEKNHIHNFAYNFQGFSDHLKVMHESQIKTFPRGNIIQKHNLKGIMVF